MFRIFMLITCILALASTLHPKKKGSKENKSALYFKLDVNNVSFDQTNAETVKPSDGSMPPGNGKIGYSSGSSLRSIAQGSADQANTAVQNQEAAGHQAAYMAKSQLAQAANAASGTAQAALAGKQVILQGVEQQARDAQQAIQSEQQQLQSAQRAAMAAQEASQQAQHHVNVLTTALNVAQATQERANAAASEAAGELAAQIAMVGSAKQRLTQLMDQLLGVRIDFEATQIAAQKAMNAAQVAQANANEAAAAAAAAQPPGPPLSLPTPIPIPTPNPPQHPEMPPPKAHFQEVFSLEPDYNDYNF